MIKEAIQYIVGLGNVETIDINGQSYATRNLDLVKAPTQSSFQVQSLTGLVDYVKSSYDSKEKLLIHIVNHEKVVVVDAVNQDKRRNQYIEASPDLPHVRYGEFYGSEEFNIKLQSCFKTTGDKEIMLKVVGNIKEESVNTIGDDGVSQSVVAKTGVATVGNVKVPNPVTLKPYRTFIEVDQPESEFIFRMKDGPRCALFEADGGAWRLVAMQNIKNYLEKELASELESEKVIIIA
ncbi:hypothetical protein H1D32_13225 [Anaerobacillus sp. CMMVII]|uniref:hypothetical protein n=1 Tax=Anaerobacillus sp. CMMVII TaxID=2755588 RepID=UPI0021B7C757|nr:hypothetical protein [Anaerobacillus sp. CMMVII]MCT8138618.1 hypothetical protein [Anaerobacillus sp. CMMVII]